LAGLLEFCVVVCAKTGAVSAPINPAKMMIVLILIAFPVLRLKPARASRIFAREFRSSIAGNDGKKEPRALHESSAASRRLTHDGPCRVDD
jgi:hypothetical protein